MANRIILYVSVLLASAALATTLARAAPAADECLAGPKGQAPAGKHWYYRTNRAIQRKCWYLGDEGATVTAVTPSKRPMSAPPDDADQERSVQERSVPERSVRAPTANARAELIDEPRREQPREQPAAPAIQPQPGAFQLMPEGADTRNAAVASRWPDPSIGFSSTPATVVNDPAPALQKNENSTPFLTAAPVETAEQPSAAADSFDDVSFAQFATALVLAFLLIVGGATLVSSVVRRLHRRKHRATPQIMRRDEMLPWARVGEANAVRRAVPRAPQQRSLADEIEEMEQLLAVAREARAN